MVPLGSNGMIPPSKAKFNPSPTDPHEHYPTHPRVGGGVREPHGGRVRGGVRHRAADGGAVGRRTQLQVGREGHERGRVRNKDQINKRAMTPRTCVNNM